MKLSLITAKLSSNDGIARAQHSRLELASFFSGVRQADIQADCHTFRGVFRVILLIGTLARVSTHPPFRIPTLLGRE